MDRLKLRGTKRRCQNALCALPFYDLNRAESQCPNCGAAYLMQPAPAEPQRRAARSFPARPRWPAGALAVAPPAEVSEGVEAVHEAELQDAAGAGELLEVEDEVEDALVEPLQEGAVEE